ncbi:MAG: hypothetical protein ACREU7_15935 [Burkholderiales bacterium]
MKTQTLASAFQAALARTARNRPMKSALPREDLLLAALQRSATGRDEIVSRRIGLIAETTCLAPQ